MAGRAGHNEQGWRQVSYPRSRLRLFVTYLGDCLRAGPGCPGRQLYGGPVRDAWHLSGQVRRLGLTAEQRSRMVLDAERRARARRSTCPGPGEHCTCGNGIGCVHVPYKDW